MWTGYFNWNGCELVNDQALFQYMSACPLPGRTINLSCKPDLGDWPCNPGPYTTPDVDEAWFYDPQIPETAEGYGIWIKSMQGWETTGVRNVFQSDLFGGVAGPLRREGRLVTVNAEVLAKTCHGATVLLQALSAILADPGCAGAQITMLECCAEDTERVGDWQRQVFGARTIEGPKIIGKYPTCNCGPGCGGNNSIDIQWSFFVPSPYIYGCNPIVTDLVMFDPDSERCNIEWVESCEPPPDPILFDPECFPTLTPILPEPTNLSCFCDPLSSVEACFALNNPFKFRDADLYFDLVGGNSEMLNWKITAYDNPLNIPCPCDDTNAAYWDAATPLFEITIPHLPANSRVTLDGRLRDATVIFQGGQREPAWRYIGATDGGSFVWPQIDACANMCIVVSADASVTDVTTATIQVGIYPRVESSL